MNIEIKSSLDQKWKFEIFELWSSQKTLTVTKELTLLPGPCCKNIRFDSTGSLADSGQNHIIGNYAFLAQGPNDRWNYKQNDGYERKLWFNPSIGVSNLFCNSILNFKIFPKK